PPGPLLDETLHLLSLARSASVEHEAQSDPGVVEDARREVAQTAEDITGPDHVEQEVLVSDGRGARSLRSNLILYRPCHSFRPRPPSTAGDRNRPPLRHIPHRSGVSCECSAD